MQSLLRSEAQFSEDSLPLLTKYLDDQLANNHYDVEANMTVLKLFAMHPTIKDFDVMRKVLLKCLMAFPSTDFQQCTFLIPEADQPEIKQIMELATLLETAKFKQFWKAAEELPLMKQTKGWEATVRDVVATCVSTTYRGIQTSTLAEFFNVKEGKDFDALVKKYQWETEGTRVVVNPTLLSAPEAAEQETQQVSSAMTINDYSRLTKMTVC